MKQVLTKLGQTKANIDLSGIANARSASLLCELLETQLLQNSRYTEPKSLMPFRQKFFSQYGQDGMLAEIFRRIGEGGKRFVEIGTAPQENNSNLLLIQGWSGLWVDAGLSADDQLPVSVQALLGTGRLRLCREFVNRENIREMLQSRQSGENLDLLSIDIDYNTYHVFTKLLSLRPRVICVEYNGLLPAELDWAAPYNASAVWDGSTFFGATLGTFSAAAEMGGYSLVGCELSGTDAFFVRHDLLGDHFARPGDVSFHWEPLRMHLGQMQRHRAALPVCN